ncbi:MAG: DNA-processing protein DprA [Bacteroidia bacterium]
METSKKTPETRINCISINKAKIASRSESPGNTLRQNLLLTGNGKPGVKNDTELGNKRVEAFSIKENNLGVSDKLQEINCKQADELQYLIALTMIDGVGPLIARGLLGHYGSAKGVFDPRNRRQQKSPAIMQRINNPMLQLEMLKAAEREIEYAARNSVEVLSYFDERYPKRLRAVADAPLILYGRGSLQKLDQLHIAVVGTRRPTAYGRKVAADFSARFAEAGVSVVSGLAFGIDMEAHLATMKTGGQTIAVLGHGIDQIYPREHYREAQKILESGGLILTEFCTGVGPESYNFPARNRIISGISDAVVVVEANETGGALITAKVAFEQDRDVYAIPGCIGMSSSQGCLKLIRDNIARIACSPDDVLDGLGHLIKAPFPKQKSRKNDLPPLSGDEEIVFLALENGPLDTEELMLSGKMSEKALSTTILSLELKNLIQRVAGNQYQQICR